MPEPYPVYSSRWLVLDDRVIEEVVEAKLTLGEITKHPQNPLFGEDKPWEPRFDNVYANVIYDTEDRLYKCWYNFTVVAQTLMIRLRKMAYCDRIVPNIAASYSLHRT